VFGFLVPSRARAFNHALANTAAALLGTAFLWFAFTFWAYLETRSVLVTSWLGGAYMLGMAVSGVPFGSMIDRHRKHGVMLASAVGTTVSFAAAWLIYLLAPAASLTRSNSPWFWGFAACVLLGALLVNVRSLALSTLVTMLVESDKRANANGMVGAVNGAMMLVTGVVSGLAIGQLGMHAVLVIAFVAVAASLAHLALLRIPETQIVHAEGTPKAVDFRGAWLAIIAVPGLLGLIVFSTFNNFLGGVFMGLLDPYGLTLMSVEAWGILFGLSSVGFIIGGAFIAKFGLGRNPLRSLLLGCLVMWVVAIGFTVREHVWLLAVGIFAYMAVIPVVEAAEQTLLQRVVPLAKQGRVFGFAQAVEVSATPVSAFLIGPIAEFWLIPYAESPGGVRALGWLLGDGDARGIALVFVLVSVVGMAVTLFAFLTRTYRRLSTAYLDGDVNAGVVPARPLADDGVPGPDVLGKGHTQS
jgi:MFS transporter, DHA3 family, multidrug efflux protein